MGVGHRKRHMERAITQGFESFKKHEIIELMLFFSQPRINTNPIAHSLIDKFGSLHNVCNAPLNELLEVSGVGRATAEFLKILPEFVRTYELSVYEDKITFGNTKEIGEYCVAFQIGRIFEAIFVLCLDTRNRLIKRVKLAEGTPGEVYIEPRQVIEQVTHTATTNVILCHNHPAGTLFPSQADLEITSKIKIALKSIDINLLDHIIVANGKYISFADAKLKF